MVHRTSKIVSALAALVAMQVAPAGEPQLEKEELKLGFIKLTDMAPLAIA